MEIPQRQLDAITLSISPTRMATYLRAAGAGSSAAAVKLYVWNAQLSAAFFTALHICEVVVRNGIAHALELKYGSNWPWNPGFERSLSTWSKEELQSARKAIPVGSTGKVIAELKFAFWCKLFTSGQDQHIWNAHLRSAFPFVPVPLTVATARKLFYDDMEALRGFRNRIAHHEPIIALPLSQHQARIQRLIRMRCSDTADWLAHWDGITAALARRP